MVTYRDVSKRHGGYLLSFILVVTISSRPWILAMLLTLVLGAVRWHQNTPIGFAALTFFATPLFAGLCVNLSSYTWWYAKPLDYVGVPPWLFPLHGLLAHWILDAYFMVTLSEVRKITLP